MHCVSDERPADPREHIDALNQTAWSVRNSDSVRAHRVAGEARELSIIHGYKLGQARAARTMAMTTRNIEDMPVLYRLAEEAKELFDEVCDDAGRAGSRDFLASVYEHQGELSVALDFALDALAIARKTNDPIRQGYALSSVGGILAASGDTDAGAERLKEALQLFEGTTDLNGVGTICSRLSRVYRDAGRHEEALHYAKRCRAVGEETQNEWSYASALFVMAQIEEERGRLDEAERLYREALVPLGDTAARNLLGAGVQVALGRLLMKTGALDKAAYELNDALQLIDEDAVSIVTKGDLHQALAELSERQERYADAVVHLRKSQALREQVTQREARNKLAQVEARAAFEAAKKDAEIHKLRFIELHAMQSKLVAAERMAVLGTLAAGAAHELNSPLGVLSSNQQISTNAVSRLLSLRGGDETQSAKLAAILESCKQSSERALERISSVAESLKRFAQLDRAELRRLDVEEGLQSALALLGPAIPGEVRVERRFAKVPPLEGSARELNQAFMTVLRNAVEAIDGAGVVSVETAATSDQLFVRIRDNGRGMNEEKAAHLFDMAWSEEGARTKMRMGLAAAQAIVQQHGGQIEVESALGSGTTVTFIFPLVRAP